MTFNLVGNNLRFWVKKYGKKNVCIHVVHSIGHGN